MHKPATPWKDETTALLHHRRDDHPSGVEAVVCRLRDRIGYVLFRGDDVIGGTFDPEWSARDARLRADLTLERFAARIESDDPDDAEVEAIKAAWLAERADRAMHAHDIASALSVALETGAGGDVALEAKQTALMANARDWAAHAEMCPACQCENSRPAVAEAVQDERVSE
jgi:hypothetical protein